MTEPADDQRNGAFPYSALEALPGLARIAATIWLHGAEWALGTSVRESLRVLDAATSPAKAAELIRDARGTARGILIDLIRLTNLDEALRDAGPAVDVAKKVADAVPFAPRDEDDGDASNGHHSSSNGHRNGVPHSLREEGESLLRRSRDVHYEEPAHPAYERIMSELAPDEARILRLLAAEGAQPAVDVRSTQLVRGGDVVAEGLTMIGAEAGVRHVEQVDTYLINLIRLGLARFSSKPLDDEMPYQVLEAQPDVLKLLKDTSRARTVHRTIRLTSFGDGFCQVCLPLDASETAPSVP
jgi:hypothetical protein